jgi:hypothetical protein
VSDGTVRIHLQNIYARLQVPRPHRRGHPRIPRPRSRVTADTAPRNPARPTRHRPATLAPGQSRRSAGGNSLHATPRKHPRPGTHSLIWPSAGPCPGADQPDLHASFDRHRRRPGRSDRRIFAHRTPPSAQSLNVTSSRAWRGGS